MVMFKMFKQKRHKFTSRYMQCWNALWNASCFHSGHSLQDDGSLRIVPKALKDQDQNIAELRE